MVHDKIHNLQSLRGIFALFIFFHHYHYKEIANIFPAGGDSGVAFFFILSGFVLCHGYSSKFTDHKISYKQFISKRVIKIYPLHLLCLVWAYALIKFSIDANQILPLLTNIFLIQSWIPESSYYFSGNSVSWCLSDLIFFYSIFPLFIRLYFNYSKLFVNLTLSIAALWVIFSNFIPHKLINPIIYINPLIRLIDFLLGICIFHAIRNFKVTKTDTTYNIYEILSLIILVVSILSYKYIPECYALSSYWWIPSAILISVFSISRTGIISKLLQLPILSKFGNISFNFYLIHALGMHTCNILLKKFGLDNLPLSINLPIILIFDTCIAMLLSRWFVNPIKQIFRH